MTQRSTTAPGGSAKRDTAILPTTSLITIALAIALNLAAPDVDSAPLQYAGEWECDAATLGALQSDLGCGLSDPLERAIAAN
jgi:hypothetical protein